jgi:hypothetical protein
MACMIIANDGVVFVTWGIPTMADVQRVFESIQTTAKQSGRRIVYIARVPADAPAPNSKVSECLRELMAEVATNCSAMHLIFEGTGFIAAAKRAFQMTLFRIAGRHAQFFVHSTVEQVARRLNPDDLPRVQTVLKKALEDGLLHGVGPESVSVRPT